MVVSSSGLDKCTVVLSLSHEFVPELTLLKTVARNREVAHIEDANLVTVCTTTCQSRLPVSSQSLFTYQFFVNRSEPSQSKASLLTRNVGKVILNNTSTFKYLYKV